AAPEHRFDFTFAEYSKEPIAPRTTNTTGAPAPPPTTQPAAPAPQAAPPAGSSAPALSPAPPSTGVDPGLIPLPIPDSVPEMLAQLGQRTDQIRRFIDQGAFASVYVPAFQAKDLALALDEHKKDLSGDNRKVADPAIKQL